MPEPQTGDAATSGDPPSGRPSRSGDRGSGDGLEQRLKTELAPRFQIIRCLGSGPKASVFLAREPDLKRLVAIKVLAADLCEDPRARARFEREAQAAASLAHPSIVAVHAVGRLSDDAPYIVMQYVKGRTMEERLEAEEALPVEEGRRVLAEIASALAAAHAKGVVHRDIRPANILHDEETGRALLADFGIAGILWTGEHDPAERLTKTGETVGDPTWMSPEQLTGQPVTERSDIYGLGLLAYALLAKRSPYEAETRLQQLRAHAQAAPLKLSKLRDGIDRQLDDLLLRCLAKEPGHRPNAADVAERLTAPPSALGAANGLLTGGFLSGLAERRVPQFVILYVVLAWALLQVVDQLADRDVVPEIFYRLSLVSVAAGLPAVLVGSWFHGKKGDQPTRPIEYWVFGALALIWLIVCAVIYLRLF
jgi:serine/threonine protein kinase